jgi:serine/threonine protein phosphatase 1
MNTPIYAIGDIHGQLDDLHRVLGLIEADGGTDAKVVFLGDYVDRGPNSKGVVDLLMNGISQGRNWTAIRGNHDRYFTRFLDDKIIHDAATRPDLFWLNPRLGGDKTLLSYGLVGQDSDPVGPLHDAALDAVPQSHRDFLKSLPNIHITPDHIFVHAGLRKGIALENQIEDDLIWIRTDWLNTPHDYGRIVVHGHTSVDYPEHHGYRVNLDAGAGYFRPLHAAVFEGRDAFVLSDQGRIPLHPPS